MVMNIPWRVVLEFLLQSHFHSNRCQKNMFTGPGNYAATENHGPNHNNLLATLICHFTAINDSQTE
jgi:hypothetical protein